MADYNLSFVGADQRIAMRAAMRAEAAAASVQGVVNNPNVVAVGTDLLGPNKIGAVAGALAAITIVAGIAGNVTTVAGIAGNVTTVAGIAGNVSTVAGIAAAVTAVGGSVSAITTLVNALPTVNALAADIALGPNASLVIRAADAALTAVAGLPLPNTYATALPRGVTSGVVGGTAATGATPGTYALVPTGGSITGVVANLIVTSATAATIQIVNPGLGSGTTAPSWAKPAGANLPAGTTLTAIVGPVVAQESRYMVLSADGLTIQAYKNDGTATPFLMAGIAVPTSSYLTTSLAAQSMSFDTHALPKSWWSSTDGVSGGYATFVGGVAQIAFNATYLNRYILDNDEKARIVAGGSFTGMIRISGAVPITPPMYIRMVERDAAGTAMVTHDLALDPVLNAYTKRGAILSAGTVTLDFTLRAANVANGALSIYRPTLTSGTPRTVSNGAPARSIEGYLAGVLNRVAPVTLLATFPTPLVTTTAPFGTNNMRLNWNPDAQGDTYTVRFRSTNISTQFDLYKLLSNGNNNGVAFDAASPAIPKLVHTLADGSGLFEATFVASGATVTGTPYDFTGLRLSIYNPISQPATVDGFVVAKGGTIPPLTEMPPYITAQVAAQIQAALAAASGTVLGQPLPLVDIWGNSLIDYNHAAGSVSAELQALLGVAVTNNGIATQTAGQIFMRAGGSPVLLSLVGDAIPAAATPVAIRNFNATNSPITQACSAANGTDPLAGSLGGVPGALTSVRTGGVVTGLTFTRTTAGAAVPISPNTPFLPAQAELSRSRYQVFAGILENNVAGSGVTQANDAADMIDRQIRRMLPVDKRYVVGSCNVGNQPSSAGSIIGVDMNQTTKKRFGAYFVDLTSAPTTEEMATIGFSPTADDVYDMDAVISGSAAGGTLTVTNVASGTITTGKYLDPEVFGQTVVITGQSSGTTGGAGVYTVNYTGAVPAFTGQTLKGFVPRGMRSGGYSSGAGVNPPGGDQLHGNGYFNKLWALRLFRFFRQRGWL